MDSSESHKCRARIPNSANQLPHLHHHHFHIHFSPTCPFHTHLLQPNIVRPQSQTSRTQDTHISNSLLFIKGEKEKLVVEEEVEDEEEDDDPMFVLTDEWKEFFTKSEAKRRLAKKEAKRKGK